MKELQTKELIIWCAGQYGNEVFTQATKIGWNVCCFCDMQKEKQGKFVRNVPVYCFEDAYEKYPHAVIIIANSNYAECMRIGRTLEEQGFIKNQSYFIAIDLEVRGILPIMKAPFNIINREIILIGPQYLCESFMEWAEESKDQIKICPSEKDIAIWKQKFPNALWIPLYRDPLSIEYDRKVNEYYNRLLEEKVLFTEWFLKHFDYCDGKNNKKLQDDLLNNPVNKILFNILPSNSGNTFLDGVLDSHPNILSFGIDMYVWSNNIWDIVKIAGKEEGAEIAERIVQKIQEYTLNAWNKGINVVSVIPLPDRDLSWLDRYRYFLCKRMNEDRRYTEKEILIKMYLAWKEACGQAISGEETVIYVDIHASCVIPETYCMTVRWLERLGFEVILIQMIRRPYALSGSVMKLHRALGDFKADTAVSCLLFAAYEIMYNELSRLKILRLRFEDVKQYPEIVLRKLCRELQILWDENMLETTSAGKISKCIIGNEETTGYDMKPVWYSYDEYFDSFDKFRLDILYREKCKAYDYSYVSEEKYPMPIDELIELFSIPFQFEKYIYFENEEDRYKYRKRLKDQCKKIIHWYENGEHKHDLFCYGPYLKVND